MSQIKAIKFTGSSTMVSAINYWINTGEFKKPQIATCDIRSSFKTDFGNLTVNLGDYVVKDVESGVFRVMPAELFCKTYGWVE
ncbi:hypothetical protein ACNAUY_07880 [Acinetobacter tibetensis]|uniref:hypothetical protein n=1 Tax=Acinetobacter tibetensis TaxID=2943497 RepID=UPI003A4D47A1